VHKYRAFTIIFTVVCNMLVMKIIGFLSLVLIKY
jgi:hypothetical protein